MDYLWAPWRKSYLEGDTLPVDGCLFCRLLEADDDQTNLIVYRGNSIAIMLNRYPYNNGHVLLLPYQHTGSLEELPATALTELMTLTQAMLRSLREAYNPDGFNMGLNIGAAAGAGVPDHVHAHLLPRWSGDTNFMTAVADVRVVPEELSATYERLRILLLKYVET